VKCRARERWRSYGKPFLLFVEVIDQLLWQGDWNRDVEHSRSLLNHLSRLHIDIRCAFSTLKLMGTGAKVGITAQTRPTIGAL
jgi:hypothetical protein